MGSRGPRPKPTKLHILHGNPGKRNRDTGEPIPDDKMPTCPSWLGREGKREWNRMSKELHRLGILTGIDRAAFACYCQCWERFYMAEKAIQLHGATITTEKGNIIQSPYVGMSNTALKIMRQYLIEFGLTPSSRSKVKTDKKPDKKEVEEFLFGKKKSAT